MKFFAKLLAKIIFAFLVLYFFSVPLFAKENQASLYFFWSKTCPHCAAEKPFLDSLVEKYPGLEVEKFEISENKSNQKLLFDVGRRLNADVSYIPFTVVGNQSISGWLNQEITGKAIEDLVIYCLESDCPDIFKKDPHPKNSQLKANVIPETLKVPLLGEINTKNLSLPVFTFVIALLDGFNPCAMWTLLFLINLLLAMKNKKRMWILGFAFISTSAFVYFLFLSAWLNLFLFIGFVIWVRIIIGLTALFAGSWNLKEYLYNKEAGCKVTKAEKRKKVFLQLKNITQKEQFIFALIGIILLAFAVNLVELVCSAGLPAIYTQVLALAQLAKWQYYLYLIFYIFIFMLDDLIVFFVAMVTLKTIGLEGKYAKFSSLIGGIILLVIGVLMLLKPELLMFG